MTDDEQLIEEVKETLDMCGLHGADRDTAASEIIDLCRQHFEQSRKPVASVVVDDDQETAVDYGINEE